MTLIQKCSRIGAAAFALGLSLAGPQVGVAAAERGGGHHEEDDEDSFHAVHHDQGV